MSTPPPDDAPARTWRWGNPAAWHYVLPRALDLDAATDALLARLDGFARLTRPPEVDSDGVTLTLDLVATDGRGRDLVVPTGATLDLSPDEGGPMLRFDLLCDVHDPDSETGENAETGWHNHHRLRALLGRLGRLAVIGPRDVESKTCTRLRSWGFAAERPLPDRARPDGLVIGPALYERGGAGLFRARVPGGEALVTVGPGPVPDWAALHDALYWVTAFGVPPVWYAGPLADGRPACVELVGAFARPAGLEPPRPVEALMGLGDAMALAHEVDETLQGVRPETVLLDADGGFVGASPRWRALLDEAAPWPDRDAYLAPEVARGAAPTPASDVWLLGALASAWLGGTRLPRALAEARATAPSARPPLPDVLAALDARWAAVRGGD